MIPSSQDAVTAHRHTEKVDFDVNLNGIFAVARQVVFNALIRNWPLDQPTPDLETRSFASVTNVIFCCPTHCTGLVFKPSRRTCLDSVAVCLL